MKRDFNTCFGAETICVFHMWLGVESSKWYLVFLSGRFLGKWIGVGSMNEEFEDLVISCS